eukprot:scaffold26711_cov196-Skeletonema_menzelii.AAC.3
MFGGGYHLRGDVGAGMGGGELRWGGGGGGSGEAPIGGVGGRSSFETLGAQGFQRDLFGEPTNEQGLWGRMGGGGFGYGGLSPAGHAGIGQQQLFNDMHQGMPSEGGNSGGRPPQTPGQEGTTENNSARNTTPAPTATPQGVVNASTYLHSPPITVNQRTASMMIANLQSSMFLKLALLSSLISSASSNNTIQFFITSAGGFTRYFTEESNGTRYGMQFQNPVYTNKGGERIGTNQGYSFWFPDDSFMLEHDLDIGQSVDALFKMPTRTFFLLNGTITVVNEAVVQATGMYSEFQGGFLLENATGTDPYEADIYLMLPSSRSGNDTSAGCALNYLIGWIIVGVSMLWSGAGWV